MVRSRMRRRTRHGRKMIQFFGKVGIALLSAALIYAGPPVGVGYLARIGPTPLRFRSAVRENPAATLPPLQIPDESPNLLVDENDEGEPQQENPEQKQSVLAPLPDLSAVPQSAVTNAPPALQGTMVPQMLLQYFNYATNHGAFISAPVEFTPPGPPITRGSSATYISQ